MSDTDASAEIRNFLEEMSRRHDPDLAYIEDFVLAVRQLDKDGNLSTSVVTNDEGDHLVQMGLADAIKAKAGSELRWYQPWTEASEGDDAA